MICFRIDYFLNIHLDGCVFHIFKFKPWIFFEHFTRFDPNGNALQILHYNAPVIQGIFGNHVKNSLIAALNKSLLLFRKIRNGIIHND